MVWRGGGTTCVTIFDSDSRTTVVQHKRTRNMRISVFEKWYHHGGARSGGGGKDEKEEGRWGTLCRGQRARRTARLIDRRLPVELEEEAADQLPQVCRDVVPAKTSFGGQRHHDDVIADPRVKHKVRGRRPGAHGVVDEPGRGRTYAGPPAHSASFGLGLAATRTSSASEVGPAQGSGSRRWEDYTPGVFKRYAPSSARRSGFRSARLASMTRWHATNVLKAGHDEAAVRNVAVLS